MARLGSPPAGPEPLGREEQTSGEVGGGELGPARLDGVEDGAGDVVGSRPWGSAGAVPASGRPASPVSVCGGRTSMTSTPDRRSSRVSALSAAVSAALLAA